MNALPSGMSWAAARRLEECALNGSGAATALAYDGWLLGARAGPSKRLRSINPFHGSTLPLPVKVDYCARFYAAAGLPAIFRLSPFAQPAGLDAWLERAGWGGFERTLVLRAPLIPGTESVRAALRSELLTVPEWHQASAALLALAPDAVAQQVHRAREYPLPQFGVVCREGGEVVAGGLARLEDGWAGLFNIRTLEQHRGRGLGRTVVAALCAESRRRGATAAYLQVTATNGAALAVYRHFGFASAYDYWYRGRPGEQR